MKLDKDKPNLSLVPPEVIIEMANVLDFGAKKYEPNNWRRDPAEFSRSYASIQRHLTAFWMGEDLDPESEKLHLSHALTQVAILIMNYYEHPEFDDRYRKDKL